VQVRAVHDQPRRVREGVEHLRAGVPVVVPGPDRDHRHPRRDSVEEARQAHVLRAVVRDLEHVHGRQRQREGHVGLRVRREQEVERAVDGVQHDRAPVGIVAGRPGGIGPEHVEPQVAEAKALPGPDDTEGDVPRRRRFPRPPPVLAVRHETRVEYALDVQRPDHVGRSAHVVASGVREDECGERAHAPSAQLTCHARLGRSLVDEDAALRHLEQDAVALADVEERDAQPGGRLPGIRRAQRPPADPAHEERAGDSGEQGAPACSGESGERDHRSTRRRADKERLETRDLRERHRSHEARAERDPPGAPPSYPGERHGGPGENRCDHRGRERGPQERQHCGLGKQVREEPPHGHLVEVEREHRDGDEAAGGGDGASLAHLLGHRVSLEPRLEPRREREDAGHGDERQLRARVERRARRPAE
jgi:hypothetical protein